MCHTLIKGRSIFLMMRVYMLRLLDENCFTSLRDFCSSFIVGLPPNLLESQNILTAHGEGIACYENELNVPYTYCVPVETVIRSVSGKVLLFFDVQNHMHLCNELSEHIRACLETCFRRIFEHNFSSG